MSEETQDVRIAALEEFRREQSLLNTTIASSLSRIETQLATAIAKHCPAPGHCMVLEKETKVKWSGDKDRFERLEKRAEENDDWHKEMETKLDGLKTVMNRGLGGVALLVVLMPIITWFVVTHLVNK